LKTYLLPRKLVAQIEQLIATYKPSPRPPSALVRILQLLCEGRQYERAGIFLAVNGREVPRAFGGAQAAAGEPRPELIVPIKISSYSIGSLRVQLAPGRSFSSQERILLHQVAKILALYLSGKGKYLVRKTREAVRDAAAPAASHEKPSRPPAFEESDTEALYAAVGEKSRR
jgi:hypothetical protein